VLDIGWVAPRPPSPPLDVAGPLPDRDLGVAITRFGTTFFAAPTAAFANVAGSLRVGARLAIATWRPLLANE
jgi:hypothetical protein